MEKITDKIKASPLSAMGLAFLVGVLLGWLAIGWWFWPVSWTDADPWDLRVEHQEVYVTLVAKSYAQSRNADLVKEVLAGWDPQVLADLIGTLQDQAPDPVRQQLTDLALALGLPEAESPGQGEPEANQPAPLLRNRLVTVCGTAVVVLVAFVLIIFAVSTRPWESILGWAQRAQAVRTPEPATGHFVSTYALGRDDYDDYFSIETSSGRFLGECGLSIGRILGRETPRRVTALEMVLFDSFDHRTETRMLMSRHAYEDTGLQHELVTRGELVLVEPDVQVLVETNNLQLLATITGAEYADQEPAEGVFQSVVVDLDIRIKHLPEEATAGPGYVREAGTESGAA